MKEPKVSIIILNYNGFTDTIECLESLKNITYKNYEIIVVDNGSFNNEAERIEEKYPEVLVIKNPTNYGFCRGNNIGGKIALSNNAEYLLFLNNDTLVEPNFLDELITFSEANPDVGIAGPLILYYFERNQVYSSGGKFNNILFYCKEFKYPYKEPQKNLNFLSGCAFLVKKSVIKKVGIWDEDYFKYWEETDYCLRAKKAGFRISCVPQSIIYHKVARTNIYLSKGYIYYMVRNNLLLAIKHAKWYYWPLIGINFFLRRWLGYTLKLSLTKNFISLPGIFWGTYDFVFNSYGKGRY
ncbi:MAG: glycosyltransferase family 2 protein [bacterium]